MGVAPPGPPLAAVRPLEPSNLNDLTAIFAAKGCSFARGCWCMAYRQADPTGLEGAARVAWRRDRLHSLAGQRPTPG